MIAEKVSLSEPIVTVRENEGHWETVLWYSNMTGLCDTEKHDTYQSAEKAAKAWAALNKSTYVSPKQTFISVFKVTTQLPPRFVACEVPFHGNVVGKGFGHLDFASAVKDAKQIAEVEHKPFAPNFYIGKGITIFTQAPKSKDNI